MKWTNRITAGLISAAMLANVGFVDVLAMDVGSHVTPSAATDTPDIAISDSHAYDPIADLEAERAYRESARIAEHKIIFSVLNYRADGAEPCYMSQNAPLCAAAGLTNISLILETVCETAEPRAGFTAYEVFYEAYTASDDVWGVVDQLRENAPILSAEPDFIWEKTDYGAATAAEYTAETHFTGLDVESIWDSLTQNNVTSPGFGTVVAVIDTGVDYNHFDLKGNMWKNTGEIAGNGVDDDGNGYKDDVYGIDLIENDGDPMDDMGHGTHVAGIIAMSPGNGGGVGLAYGAKIMAVKAGQANGTFAASDIAKAVKYAADNGADVINMSFGGAGKSSLVEAALRDAFGTSVLVAAAGNDGQPTADAHPYGYPFAYDCYPAAYSYVLGVMATENNGNLAGFSNWDWKIGVNGEYELAAPGVGIYSTLPGDRFAYWSGTSMAAPNVAAAAAIIRSRYTDKGKYSSRYIMGQLVSATKDSTKPFVDKLGNTHVYPALNIKDSLKYQPKPSVKLQEFYLFDDKSISDANNGDGIAQPGETIDIGISAFNYWGTAADVTVKVDADSIAGIPNPYVEFVTDTATIGEIGTFMTMNNGFTYTNGALTGVTKPLRIKIKEGAPNDAQVQLNFTVTAKNGLDDKDTVTYTSTGNYTITIQNGYALSGVIRKDMTLTPDKYWIIQNNVLIPEGVTVTVEPGTQIQFWSADPVNPYGDEADVYIQVDGSFIAEGTEDAPIQMFPGKGSDQYGVIIFGASGPIHYTSLDQSILDADFSKSYASLKYVDIVNAGISNISEYRRSFATTSLDHCRIISNCSIYNPCSLRSRTMTDTIVQNYRNKYLSDLWIMSFDINGCLFECNNQFLLSPNINRDLENTVFLRNTKRSIDDGYIGVKTSIPSTIANCGYSVSGRGKTNQEPNISNNSFLSKLDNQSNSAVRKITAYTGHNVYDISGNYWGTTNPDLVKLQCYDADWNVSLDDLIQEPYLTLESPELASIYPFMTEAYLTDTDGNRIDTVAGKQTVTMHVKFNRDMAQDIQPSVSYGGSEPYTDFMVSGDWASAREWTGTFTIDPYIDLGRMYIRSKGAAAANDKWLVTGEDSARFFFEVVTSTSAQSMSLQGNGGSGANELSWMQDDYATFAGYNVYRAEAYDSSKTIAEQSFTKLNISVLNTETFRDTNVEQGKDYWYYFTVVDTGFKESKPSNVVKCTPIDEEKPVITHTPAAHAVAGEAVALNADVTDNVTVSAVTLHYRKSGDTDWKTADMRNVTGNTYRAVISAYDVTEGTIEYYITASDGTNTETSGTASEPHQITVQTEHNFDTGTEKKAATCTETGEMLYKCLDCGFEKTVEIPALGHDFSTDWTTDKEPTCTAVGEKSHHCIRCDAKDDVTEIPMIDHVWDGGKVTKSNSCTVDGTTHFKCIHCDAEKDETIPATGHNYKDTVHPATCTAKGYTDHVCQNCNASYQDTFTEMIAHDYEEMIINPATCTVDGLKQLVCKNCGDTKNVILPATGHTFEDTIHAVSCDAEGYTEHVCKTCGECYKTDFVSRKDHQYEETIVTPASCTTAGTLKRVCKDCGDVQMVEIPATGHNFKATVHPATCTAQGYTEHVCQNCGASYQDTFKPMIAHDYEETIITPASCTTAGALKRVCKDCGDVQMVEIPATGHNFKATVHPATCTAQGYTEHVCQNCGASYQDTFKPMTAHQYEDTIVKPDADHLGYTLHTCKDCGHSYKDSYTELPVGTAERTPGDVNEDGQVDLMDVILIRRYIVGGWELTINLSNADVNGDGAVDLLDIIRIRRYLAGGWNVTLV